VSPNYIWRPKLELSTDCSKNVQPSIISPYNNSSEACSIRPVININQYTSGSTSSVTNSEYTSSVSLTNTSSTSLTNNSTAGVTKEDAIAGLDRFISYIDRQPSVTPILKDVIYEYKRFVEMKL